MKKILIGLGITSIALTASLASVSAEDMMSGTMMKTEGNMNLMMTSRGEKVIALQTFLESKGYLMLPEGVSKGYFGYLTKSALMKYQSEMGVPSTGFFGPLTRAKWMMSTNGNMSMKGDATMKDDSTMKTEGVMVGGALMISSRDIVDNAVLANNVTTVVAAVKAAGLVETLKSKGPFTVFAPTNAAFAALPAGTVNTLLLPENKGKLTEILTYHVVGGAYKIKDLMDGQVLTIVNGKNLTITKVDGKVMINGSAMVETPNVTSSNGVTHVISAVLIP